MSQISIPRIIHQVWVGDSEMPEHCREFVNKMSTLNPNYKHIVWGNEIFTDIYKDDPYLQQYVKDPEGYKWAFICDRIRMLLLRDYGGIYCDVDCNPIQSFDLVMDKLSPDHTFFSGLKPSQDNNTLVDCTVYGSAPNSRIVNICLSNFTDIHWTVGCRWYSESIIKHCDIDVALFGYEYFYDDKITDKTVVLHDLEETRLFSWAHNEEVKKKENW